MIIHSNYLIYVLLCVCDDFVHMFVCEMLLHGACPILHHLEWLQLFRDQFYIIWNRCPEMRQQKVQKWCPKRVPYFSFGAQK